jgi:HK97 gp10 family phage protein
MDVQVRGLKELDERLVELGAVAGAKAMRSAMFTASKPILDRAKATAPVKSGALREALARTFSVSKGSSGSFGFLSRSGGFGSGKAKAFGIGVGDGSRFSILIGPKVRNRTAVALYNLVHKTKRRGIYHGHFLEFGHRIGSKRTGRLSDAVTAKGIARAQKRGLSFGAGSVPGIHFLRNALAATASQATAKLAEALKKRIEAAARKR